MQSEALLGYGLIVALVIGILRRGIGGWTRMEWGGNNSDSSLRMWSKKWPVKTACRRPRIPGNLAPSRSRIRRIGGKRCKDGENGAQSLRTCLKTPFHALTRPVIIKCHVLARF